MKYLILEANKNPHLLAKVIIENNSQYDVKYSDFVYNINNIFLENYL